ncbi:MAG TPA: diacylglycerol kinase family protein [Candidatus Krumholzibacteria bacterium]
MKALIVLSAGAGKGEHQTAHDAVRRVFAEAGIEFTVYTAQNGDRVDDMVREHLAEGYDLVVAGGGDGTVSCALAALLGTDIPLGIIPLGTGNIVAREFDIPVDIEDAVALLAASPSRKQIDAMKIGDRVCVLNAGVGINARVIAHTSSRSKSRFGRLAYVATTLRMIGYRPRRIDVTVDGTKHRFRAIEVSVNNCGTLAQAVYPRGPDYCADDGQVDIWILGMETVRDYVHYLVGLVFGRRKNAFFMKASQRVVIDSRVAMTAQADGDIIGTTPLEVDVLPRAVTLLVPPA